MGKGDFVVRTISTTFLIALFGYVIFLGSPYLPAFVGLLIASSFVEMFRILPMLQGQKSIPFRQGLTYWVVGVTAMAYQLPIMEIYGSLCERHPALEKLDVPTELTHYSTLLTFVIITGAIMLSLFSVKPPFIGAVIYYLWLVFVLGFISLGSLVVHASMVDRALFLVPITLVSINDIAAYLFGVTLGKHKMIRVSPSKSWEGFLGAAFVTLIAGHFICPRLAYWASSGVLRELDEGEVAARMAAEYAAVGTGQSMYMYPSSPLYRYSLIMATWVATIGPVGGLTASLIKRAAGTKDFGKVIPGHGGVLDRIDCHILGCTLSWIAYKALSA
ncbi:Phosphatidate cytidylyltransferase [Giardia muris]|uniref:Phosphatidate cytidylyltransferase n=1 Tax=Giardia muris TaxID=5742 RepID=A0A4Z1SXF0_GIAMU|nr:Phosphatidate cytidylyltransferase [Giardia muris]|eukprot:TNJ30404.1 Phosphatidate cytidylyltransferase [Giardia muris]